jgi:nucleoside-diphosphate-sugar epimerase
MNKVRAADRELVVWGTGKRKLQFIHVADAAANLVAAARARGDFFMVGHPEAPRVDQVAQLLMRLMGKRLRIRHDLSKPDKPSKLFRFTNPARLRYDLRRGLADLLS